jgi:hypothetical protein
MRGRTRGSPKKDFDSDTKNIILHTYTLKGDGIMGTAVLTGKPGISLGEKVRSGKEDSPKQENVLERVARRLRLAGHNAGAVCERCDAEDTLECLKSWRDKKGRENKK